MKKENIYEFMGQNINEKDFYQIAPKFFVEGIRTCQATRKLREPEEFDRNAKLYYHPTVVDEKKVYECLMTLDYLPYSINRRMFIASCVSYCTQIIHKQRRLYRKSQDETINVNEKDNTSANDKDSIFYSIMDYSTILNVIENQITNMEPEIEVLGL